MNELKSQKVIFLGQLKIHQGIPEPKNCVVFWDCNGRFGLKKG